MCLVKSDLVMEPFILRKRSIGHTKGKIANLNKSRKIGGGGWGKEIIIE